MSQITPNSTGIRRAVIPKALMKCGLILLVVLGTLLSITLFAQKHFQCGPLSFTLRSRPAETGGSVIVVPPVGLVFFKTHRTPWQISFTLDEIDFNSLEKELGSMPKEQWPLIFQDQILASVREFFLIMAVCGLFGGAAALLILRIFPNSRTFWMGISIAALTVLLLIGSIVATFDKRSVERPQYQGVLASAPWVMNLISTSLDNIEVIGANLRKVSGDLPLLYRQAGKLEEMGDLPTDLRVLHVSDIHNNPAAFDFIAQLISNFKINLIVDTGDLTDYGTALEATIVPKIAELRIPYVFIPGNHDTPLIMNHLKRVKNIHILNKGVIRIKGLTIAGLADPASFNDSSEIASAPEMEKARLDLEQLVAGMTVLPDIVTVHNLILAKGLIGKVPLVLHGHDHRFSAVAEHDTMIIDAGTTGAAGMRGLADKAPYSAAVLYWKKDNEGQLRLQIVDSIRINGYQGMMTIDRQVIKTQTEQPAENVVTKPRSDGQSHNY